MDIRRCFFALALFIFSASYFTTSYAVISAVQINNDKTNLNIKFQENLPYNYSMAYIDNGIYPPNTGYKIYGLTAERYIILSYFYKSTGAGPIWSFTQNVPYSAIGTTRQWSMPLAALGFTESCVNNRPIKLVLQAGYNGSASDLTGVINYTITNNCTPVPPPPPPTSTQKIISVAYFYPDCSWNANCDFGRLMTTIPPVGMVIVNPNSGPGSKFDPNYLPQIQKLQAKGATVVGYISTNYGKVPLATVQAEINSYYNWYHLDGIFFDEGYSSDCTKTSYYTSASAFVKTKGGKAVTLINYGTNVPECYATASDIVVNYEDSYANYTRFTPLAWYKKYPASKFYQIVHTLPQANLANAVALSRNMNAGWVYFTPLTLAQNPYGALPNASYWGSETTLVAKP